LEEVVSDRPIIFSAPMVRALLAGRKTQTRRVLKKQDWPEAIVRQFPHQKAAVPYLPGDRLWVKEPVRRSPDVWLYEADGEMVPWPGREELAGRKRDASPAMYLPRSCSRLTLLVKDVRVERLQEISEADARAEGAIRHVPCKSSVAGTTIASDTWHYDHDLDGRLYEGRTAQDAFEILWGKINGWKSWDANPWIAAVTFSVHARNLDQISAVTAEDAA
jgi:hypothetical protein